MNKYNLTNLDVACQHALEVLLRPRYFYLIEPWLMTAKQQQKQSIIKAADYVEGKSSGGALPAIQKNRYGLRRPTATKYQSLDQMQYAAEWKNVLTREGTQGRFKHYSEPAKYSSLALHPIQQERYAFLLHSTAASRLEDWQGTDATMEERARLASTLESLLQLQENLPGYDDASIPPGIDPHDRLYLESYCRRIRAEPGSGDLEALAADDEEPGRSQSRAPTTDAPPRRNLLQSHLYLPFKTVDFTTTNQRMMHPPPPGLGTIYTAPKDEEKEKVKSTLISPIILSEKLAIQ